MPIADADAFIDELEKVCRGEKTSTLVRMGDYEVLLERRDQYIVVNENSWLPTFRNSFTPENVQQAVARYKELRKNYGEDGRYPVDSVKVEID